MQRSSKRNRWRSIALGAGLLLIMAGYLLPSRALPPKTLGVLDGRFSELPETPNAVSSQTTDEERRMDPLPWSGTRQEALEKITEVVESFPRTRIVTSTDSYLHVEFRSRWIGFVDDVEFYVPEEGHPIHFRSASRVGYSDLGVNRKRMEQIGRQLAAQD